jgi:uncharacterized protein
MSAYVSQYVLKVCGRCDLACDHCYVFEHADHSWRHKPKVMAEETVAEAARRISEHAQRHLLDRVSVVLHGGEPLLLGRERLTGLLSTLRSVIDPVARLALTVHTNGVLLDEGLCDLFNAFGVRVGVSLDGDRAANDRHRRYADGRSSYHQVLRALALLRRDEYRHLYAGILCTVDVANDPLAVYEAVLAQAPPRFDLLLPHATWDNPPAGASVGHAPYAAWLGQIHDRWVADDRPVPIRLFDSLLAAWEGRSSGSEAVGLDPVDLLVLDTDGGWEQADSLKTAYDGAPATGFEVFSHSVDQAATHQGLAARRAGLGGLCHQCRACSIVRACGGGLYAHRYRSINGFANPSVYCDDLKVLIPRVISAPRRAAPEVGAQPKHQTRTTATGRERAHRHPIDVEDLDLFAAGPGDRAAMTKIVDVMNSANRALVVEVARRLGDTPGALGRAAADGWRLLSALDAEHPQAVRDILTYPYVQAWATRCLGRNGTADARDRAHLGGVAAAAALRAGIETEVILPVRDGAISLPGVGAFIVAPGTGPVARVRISPSGVSCDRSAGPWQAVRRVTATGLTVTVDDVDPFRDCQAWVPAGRLPAAAWESWQAALPTAISRLAAELPGYASALCTGLRSVVPILPEAGGARQSGSTREAFGAAAVTFSDDPGSLAELLLHEMQHVKLAVLADQFDLFDQADGRLFSVPWRRDRRSAYGLLHGTYAHLALAELWRARARATPDQPTVDRYRLYRSWVGDAIDLMLAAGCLSPAGERFAEGMLGTVRGWADDW